MFHKLFAPKPPLDEPSIEWIFQVFDWALRWFDAAFFRDQTRLVAPTNEWFPGRATSVHGMAELIFRSTAGYAGMGHWPLRLLSPGAGIPLAPPLQALPHPLRGPAPTEPGMTPAGPRNDFAFGAWLPVAYDPALVNNPEALIAGLAQTLAHHQATEIIAVFLGFGVLFANTAFQFQSRSCGSCGGPSPQRQAFLSQFDITYALALFCALKDLSLREAQSHLKSALRPHLKSCLADVTRREAQLDALRTRLIGA